MHPRNGETPWAKFKQPSAERSEAIGGYSNGCLRGAIALPESGEGFRSIRRFRNRYYGHSELVDFVTGLGEKIVDDELAGTHWRYVTTAWRPYGLRPSKSSAWTRC